MTTMKIPGPDHPITIAPNGRRVRIMLGGTVIADTLRALTLLEGTYKPVLYIPREDARMDLLGRTTHGTHCPYKGTASYYTVWIGDRASENAAWSYEEPYPAMRAIAGHLAFYRDRVDAIEETETTASQTA